MTADPHDPKAGARSWPWLALVFLFAVAARSLDFQRVLLSDGEVVFAPGDAFYHARRALFSFLEFPALLRFDPCINFPDGAFVPHPPLLDWTTAALARLFGDDITVFEATAAWLPVLLTSLSVFLIFALGRRVATPGVGLLAAGIYAGLPICVNYGQLGNFDHHALAGLIGAAIVFFSVRGLGRDLNEPDGLVAAMVALAFLRVAMMLTWTGSLLYLLPADAALLSTAALARDPARLRALGWSAAGTAVLAWPAARALAGAQGSGVYSAVEFSPLHALVYLGLAVLCGVHAVLSARWPARSAKQGGLRVVGLALPIIGLALTLPGVADGLFQGLRFLGASDGYTETVVEQLPVFWGQGRFSLSIAHARMGAFVYLIPLVPVAFALQSRRRPPGFDSAFLAAWTLLLGFLAVGQIRYLHDFAPAGCVGFALVLARLADTNAVRAVWPAGRNAFAAAAAAVLLLPAIPGFYAPVAALAWHGARGELKGIDRALLSVSGSQLRFAQLVEDATEVSGRCPPGSGAAPAYGVMAHVGLGHVLHYSGRRATPADPFGPYIGRENFTAAQNFMQTTKESRAVRIMERLSARYVATAADAIPRPARSMAHRLHANDGGYRPASPQLGRFRLLTEGPTGGLAMSELFGEASEDFAPYKLFELVAGAELELRLPPGAQLTAELPLKTPTGRRFVYRAAARADASGAVRLRVPYSHASDRPRVRPGDRVERVSALGPYLLKSGERRFRVSVPESAVREGRTLSIEPFEF